MTPVQQVVWNKSIRDSVDALLHRGGYSEESSARHQLSMMNFDEQAQAVEPVGMVTAHRGSVAIDWTGKCPSVGTPLFTRPAPTTRPLTPAEKSELLEAGVTGECVRVLAFNDRPATGVPLSDEQIDEIALQEGLLLICDDFDALKEITRAVEAHHGIGAKQ